MATLYSENVSWLRISPRDWQKSFDLPGNHKIFDLLIVNFVGNFPLSQLQCKISHAHESYVNRKRHYREGDLNLIVFLRVQNEKEQYDGQNVFEMESRINNEIPGSKTSLVPIGIDLVLISNLVSNQLMKLTTLELHLFLIKLVLNVVRSSLAASDSILELPFLLIIDLAHTCRNTLTIVHLVLQVVVSFTFTVALRSFCTLLVLNHFNLFSLARIHELPCLIQV